MKKTWSILYIEDDAIVMTAYQKRLEQEGFHVITARDGLEAIKRLSIFSPDLVLLDLMLPKFSGEEVLQFIRNHKTLSSIPVIILSTNSVADMANEPLLESASHRIIKSHCTPATLLASIHAALPEEAG